MPKAENHFDSISAAGQSTNTFKLHPRALLELRTHCDVVITMSFIRRMTPIDLLSLNLTNLDPLTENYDIGFYLNYLMRWPSLFSAVQDRSEGIVGYSTSFADFALIMICNRLSPANMILANAPPACLCDSRPPPSPNRAGECEQGRVGYGTAPEEPLVSFLLQSWVK